MERPAIQGKLNQWSRTLLTRRELLGVPPTPLSSTESESRSPWLFLPGYPFYEMFPKIRIESDRRLLDGILQTIVASDIERGASPTLTRSVPKTLLTPDIDRNKRVKRRFIRYKQILGDLNLGSSANALMSSYSATAEQPDCDIKIAAEEVTYGLDFLARARGIFSKLNCPDYQDYDPSSKKYYVVGQTDDGLTIEFSSGKIDVNPARNHARVRLIRGDDCLFILDIGFFPMDPRGHFYDARAGGLVSTKSQLGLKLMLDANKQIVIDQREVKRARKDLQSPDDFKIGGEGEIDVDVIRMLRAIREGIVFTDYRWPLFTPRAIKKMRLVFARAAAEFEKRDPKNTLGGAYRQEVKVAMEANAPYFLYIANLTGLLRIFPYFRKSRGAAQDLLTSDALANEVALYYAGQGNTPRDHLTKILLQVSGQPLPPKFDPIKQRGLMPIALRLERSVLDHQIREFEKDKYSGLALFYYALKGQIRSEPMLEAQQLVELEDILSFGTTQKYTPAWEVHNDLTIPEEVVRFNEYLSSEVVQANLGLWLRALIHGSSDARLSPLMQKALIRLVGRLDEDSVVRKLALGNDH